MAEEGCIVIADITGYTAFLSGSELEHAQDSLRSLLNLLIQETKPPQVISRLEGDAVISYAPKGSFIQSQTLVESIENTYVAFRHAQQHMRLNTSCTCAACRNIPNLDLKFLVHHGSFALQDLGPYTELVGNDVNLIHRLLKNSVTEDTGIKAYAAYTRRAVEGLEMVAFADSLLKHVEQDPHEGEIRLYIQDLKPIWERDRERMRIIVDRDQALFSLEYDFPLPPTATWDYLTTPEARAILFHADGMSLEKLQRGRTASGAVYVCAHGDMELRQVIVDWRPFEYFTFEVPGPLPGTKNLVTTELTATASGTHVTASCSKTSGPETVRSKNDALILENLPTSTMQGFEKLHERVQADIELGVIVRPQATSLASEHVEAELASSLRT